MFARAYVSVPACVMFPELASATQRREWSRAGGEEGGSVGGTGLSNAPQKHWGLDPSLPL